MTSVYRIRAEVEVSDADSLLEKARSLKYSGPADTNTVLASLYSDILSVEALEDSHAASLHDMRARKVAADKDNYELTARVVVKDEAYLLHQLLEDSLGHHQEELRQIYREDLGAAIAEAVFSFEDGGENVSATSSMYGLKPVGRLVAEMDSSPSAAYVLSDLEEPDPLQADIAQKVEESGMRVIGITGLNRDHVAQVAQVLEQTGLQMQSVSGPLKRSVAAMYSLPESTMFDADKRHQVIPHIGYTPEELLQRHGTDLLRRHGHPDINLRMLTPQISAEVNRQLDEGVAREQGIALIGVRFENEAALVRSIGGTMLHVVSPDGADEERAMHKKHVTELGITFKVGDAKLDFSAATHEGLTAKAIERELDSAQPDSGKQKAQARLG